MVYKYSCGLAMIKSILYYAILYCTLLKPTMLQYIIFYYSILWPVSKYPGPPNRMHGSFGLSPWHLHPAWCASPGLAAAGKVRVDLQRCLQKGVQQLDFFSGGES